MTDSGEEETELNTYECTDCDYRTQADHKPGECPQCGGEMLDISVSRE
jgi:hypothetical protein